VQPVFAKYPTLLVPPGIMSDTMCDYTITPRIHRYAQGINSERVRWIIAPSSRLHVILSGRPCRNLVALLRPMFEACGRVLGFHDTSSVMTMVDFESTAAATDCLATYHNFDTADGRLMISFTDKRLR
jgi:hypothetical protein